jgi:DNA-binding NtrC family response regulator
MVLIVEDNALVATSLASYLMEECDVETHLAANVATAEAALVDRVDFAFLDVDVMGGNTYRLAQRLNREHVPFAFVSGSDPARVPVDLRGAPFLSKPCPAPVVARALATALWQKKQQQLV